MDELLQESYEDRQHYIPSEEDNTDVGTDEDVSLCDETVSQNEVEILQNILQELERINSEEFIIDISGNNVNSVYNMEVVDRLDKIIGLFGSDETETSLSENNIMIKKLESYTVQESLTLGLLLGLIIGIFVHLFRRGIPKWR